ncbi:MAG: HAMP domain-containing protein [bacterium]|nr:MAG: HAMP domain-containing protein [bacterium]
MKIFISLRFKILFSFLLLVTVVVGAITYTMANLFHADKTAYIKDFISTNTRHTAAEVKTMIQNYLDSIKTFTRVAYDGGLTQDEKSRMFDQLFTDYPEMVAVIFYEGGREQASIIEELTLTEAGTTRAELDAYRAQHPIPSSTLRPGVIHIRNSTFLAELPLMTIATAVPVPGRETGVILEALVRMDGLMAIMGQSEVLEAFIAEPGGSLLVHRDPEQVLSGDSTGWIPGEALLAEQSKLDTTHEYVIDGTDMIGSFSPVEIGDLVVGMRIPLKTAYLTARSIFMSLLGVSLVILLGAAAASLFWSRRITRPLEELSEATRDVGRGHFDIQLNPASHDEIGSLTGSVNRMAVELREREKTLAETQAALIQSEKMSAFGQLSAGIAHEVKNPLAGILGYAQLSLKKLEQNNSLYKNLTIIEKETRRCNAIIENLMKFARQDQPQLVSLSINDVLEDSLVLADHQLGIHEIGVEKTLRQDLPEISGDANQLIQVFMNLLINAQQAMDGKPGTVTVATDLVEQDTVEIRIKDTGPGIPPEEREKIFEPFFTTKAAGKGTGLGLAVTFGIIKDHGGDIRVEGEPGQGAIFVITLPATGSAIEKDTPAESQADIAG